ncbi:PREDICTED: uncharacterized protein LOC108774107 [Cyphomyrmex costatus]|uniref:uncharacterized protein LOC108774107 n=1 Tax=Cyphomyrmex costatus TaxID=456900 RepID=UPI0008522B5D|nr:PREDICTED: uncharacterized protein LOC108774107 [Cyphomyrmex costatus]XP_018395626.1 PREDICTED: uncharacterized protein LOC108774107 [Cyphomyrmex costatus]
MDFNQSNLEMENEEVMSEEYLDEIETLVLEGIYSIEDKVQDDLDLIALVEGNPRFYVKGKAGYRNVHEKDMAWVSIDKALKHPISGSEAKHRWARYEISMVVQGEKYFIINRTTGTVGLRKR